MIVRSRIILGVVAAMLATATVAQSESPMPKAVNAAAADKAELDAFTKAIRAKYDLKQAAFAARDTQTIVTRFYTEDARTVGEGEGAIAGRKDLEALYDGATKEYSSLEITSVHPFVRGNAGWDWAELTAMPSRPEGKPWKVIILFLWTKVGDEWMCKGDFFVSGSLSQTLASPEARQ